MTTLSLIRKLFIVAILAASLSSCAIVVAMAPSADKLNELSVGMNKKDAIKIMGNPDRTSAKDNVEYLIYRLAYEKDFSKSWFFGIFAKAYKDDYFVKIVKEKVDSYGRLGDFDSTKDPKFKLEISK